MQVNEISKSEFLHQVYERTVSFVRAIQDPQIFVVKEFCPKDVVLDLRAEAHRDCAASESSWHPLIEGCPDYHRLHDNHPKAHVKQKLSAYYYHPWYPKNRTKFALLEEVFH